jgi:hypothetical protein
MQNFKALQQPLLAELAMSWREERKKEKTFMPAAKGSARHPLRPINVFLNLRTNCAWGWAEARLTKNIAAQFHKCMSSCKSGRLLYLWYMSPLSVIDQSGNGTILTKYNING